MPLLKQESPTFTIYSANCGKKHYPTHFYVKKLGCVMPLLSVKDDDIQNIIRHASEELIMSLTYFAAQHDRADILEWIFTLRRECLTDSLLESLYEITINYITIFNYGQRVRVMQKTGNALKALTWLVSKEVSLDRINYAEFCQRMPSIDNESTNADPAVVYKKYVISVGDLLSLECSELTLALIKNKID